ncbi:hypothetical protein N9D03_08795, partial [Alphaproteobacteria bacterium]|nr:hypothetical protein [Alphaproteobacteria bacterium]
DVLEALSGSIAKVDNITSLTVTGTEEAAEIGNLLGKATNATVTATAMDAADLAQVADNISGVSATGISGVTFTITDSTSDQARSAIFDGLTDDQAQNVINKVGTNTVAITGNDDADWIDLRGLETNGVSFQITGLAGDNVIYSGDGNDTITTLGGADYVEVGGGLDNVNTGDGDDVIGVRSLDDVTGSVYNGGNGTDTLRIYGTNDVTGSTLTSIENVELKPGSPSKVFMTIDQVNSLAKVIGTAGNSEVVVVNDPATFTVTNGITLAGDGTIDTLAFTFNGTAYTATVAATSNLAAINLDIDAAVTGTAKSFDASTKVSSANETIEVTGHGLSDGDPVLYSNGGNANLTNLVDGTIYYVVETATNTFKVSATEGGTAIDLTLAGSSQTHSFTKALGPGQITATAAGNNLLVTVDKAVTNGSPTTLTSVVYTSDSTGTPAVATTSNNTVTDVDLTGVTFEGLQKLTTSDAVTATLTATQLANITEIQTDADALTVNLNGVTLAADLDIRNANLAAGSTTINVASMAGFTLSLSQAQATGAVVAGGNAGVVKIYSTPASNTVNDAALSITGLTAIHTDHNITLVVNPTSNELQVTENGGLTSVDTYEILTGKTLNIAAGDLNGATFTGDGVVAVRASGDYSTATFSGNVSIDVKDTAALTLDAVDATTRTITASGSGNGSVAINAGAPATAYDFSGIATGLTTTLLYVSTGTIAPSTVTNWSPIDTVNIQGPSNNFDAQGDVGTGGANAITLASHGYSVGNRIFYNDGGGTGIGLTSDTVYYVESVVDANNFTVSATSGGAAVALTALGGSETHTVRLAPDVTISAAGLSGKTVNALTGASVIVSLDDTAGLDFSNTTVASGGTFTATVSADTTLASDTELGALAVSVDVNKTLTLTAAQATGKTITGNGSLTITGATPTTQYDFSNINMGTGVATLKTSGSGTLLLGTDLTGIEAITTSGTDTLTLTATQAGAKTLTTSGSSDSMVINVATGNDLSGGGLNNSVPVRYSLVIADGASASMTHDQYNGASSITGAGGTETITFTDATGAGRTFDAADVATATDILTDTSHGFDTGDAVMYTIPDGGTALNNLTSGSIYYVIKVDANTYKLASTFALANAGTAIDITDTQGDGHIVTKAISAANVAVENYTLAAGQNLIKINADQLAVNVAGTGANNDTVDVAGLTVTGTYNLAGGADVIAAHNGADIKGATIGNTGTGRYSLDIADNASVTLTTEQNNDASD